MDENRTLSRTLEADTLREARDLLARTRKAWAEARNAAHYALEDARSAASTADRESDPRGADRAFQALYHARQRYDGIRNVTACLNELMTDVAGIKDEP